MSAQTYHGFQSDLAQRLLERTRMENAISPSGSLSHVVVRMLPEDFFEIYPRWININVFHFGYWFQISKTGAELHISEKESQQKFQVNLKSNKKGVITHFRLLTKGHQPIAKKVAFAQETVFDDYVPIVTQSIIQHVYRLATKNQIINPSSVDIPKTALHVIPDKKIFDDFDPSAVTIQ